MNNRLFLYVGGGEGGGERGGGGVPAPVLARAERTRALHRLLQIIVDFMVETPAF